MSELETLNMLLRLIGSSPVNSLDTTHPDAANALATMSRSRKRAQRRGWWCNIEYNIILSPDSNNDIKLAREISSLVAENSDYIVRDNRLYDKRNQTSKFYENVPVTRLIYVLTWDEMPAVMQEYCAYLAAAEFIRDELEDPQKEASARESAATSYLDLKKQDLEEGNYNIFQKTRVARARGGIQPYSRNNKRFFGDPDV